MTPQEVVQMYFNAWNARDPAAILATFVDGGTYSDPVAGAGNSGSKISDYAGALFTAFPDMSLELVCNKPAQNGVMVAPWNLFGSHQGPLMDNDPTGKKVEIPGCDFIVVDGDKLRSVTGYFDPQLIMQQLGLA